MEIETMENISRMNLFLHVAHISRRADSSHNIPIPDLDGVIVAASEEKLESILLNRYEYRRIEAGLEPHNGTVLEMYYDAGWYISRYDQTVLFNLCVTPAAPGGDE
jgi:hypothetical protein